MELQQRLVRSLDMNDNRITGLPFYSNSSDKAVKKEYLDDMMIRLKRQNIKPSHTVKYVFRYHLNDVNGW